MLCVAWSLLSRGVLLSVRPSVCPSRWCIVLKRLNFPSDFFSSLGGPIIQVFPQWRPDCEIPAESSPTGARNRGGYQKFAISHCILEMMRNRAIVTMER